MKTFNEWLGDRHSPQGILVPIIKLGFNRRDELSRVRHLELNFSARPEPKDQQFEPRVLVRDPEFINYIMDQLSEDEKLYVTNNMKVSLEGEVAERIIKDNIGRSELGWANVMRYYGLTKQVFNKFKDDMRDASRSIFPPIKKNL